MKRWLALAMLLALVMATGAAIPGLAQPGQARVRGVNASPNVMPVDVLVNGATAFSSVAFTGVTPYTTINAAVTNLRFVLSGNPTGPLFNINVQLLSGVDSTIVAVGTPNSVEPVVLFDDNRAPAPGQARVRFMNASPNSPALTVAVSGGPVLFSSVPFKQVGGYISITAGTFNLEVRDSGTGRVLATMPNVALGACNVFTIFAMGLVDGQPPLQLVTSTDAVTTCATAVAAAAATVTPSPTPTRTSTATMTPTGTQSVTATMTPTGTQSVTATMTPTGTRSVTPTAVASSTPSGAPSSTPLASPSATTAATSVPTSTPLVPTATMAPATSVATATAGATAVAPTSTTGGTATP